MSCCSDFDKDIVVKKGHFIACVNDIITEFSFAHPHMKCKLLQTYGTSFYGSCLWNLYGKAATSLYTTWNIAIRKLNGVPYRTHTRFLDVISDFKHIRFSLKRRFLCFVSKLLKSTNTLISNITDVAVFDAEAPTGVTLSRIISEYNLGTVSNFRNQSYEIIPLLDAKYKYVHGLSDVEHSYCLVIKDLVDCIHGSNKNGLTYDECREVIEYLATI